MKRALLLTVVLALTLPSLSGCWNRRELNELAIAAGMGIDKRPEGYLLTVQIVNAQEIASRGGSGYAAPVAVFSAEGETIMDAVRRLTKVLSRRLYLSQLRVVVIGEELAKSGVSDVMDFLSRDHEMRTDFVIAIARGSSAEQVMATLTSAEKIPSNKMYNTLEVVQNYSAVVSKITLDMLLSDLLSEGTNPVLAGIRLIGDPEATRKKENVEKSDQMGLLEYSGMGAFREDKLVGWLDEDEGKGYNFVKEQVKSTVLNLACPRGGPVSVEVIRSKAKVKGRVENGKPAVSVNILSEGNIGDVECEAEVSKLPVLEELESKLSEEIRRVVRASIDKSQKKLKTDIFGFGEAIHRADPKVWKSLKDNWTKTYADMPVDIQVDAHIRRIGTITDPLMKKKKE